MRNFLDSIGGMAIVGCTAVGLIYGGTTEIKLASGFAGAFALTRLVGAYEDREHLESNQEFQKKMTKIHKKNLESYRSLNGTLQEALSSECRANIRLIGEKHALIEDYQERLWRVRREAREIAQNRVNILESRAKRWESLYRNSVRDRIQLQEEQWAESMAILERSLLAEPVETKTPELCENCSFCAESDYLLCAVNPTGPSDGICSHFEAF